MGGEEAVIRPVGPDNLADLNTMLDPFPVIGRLAPVFNGARWSWTEELYAAPEARTFPPEVTAEQAVAYIGSPDRQIFFAYTGGACAGQAIIRRNWNAYCFVEDLAVGAAHRGRGIARRLLTAAEEWGAQRGLKGLMLEAQDTNLAACRAYAALGFTLGGVDRLLYANCAPPGNGELALFWYREGKA